MSLQAMRESKKRAAVEDFKKLLDGMRDQTRFEYGFEAGWEAAVEGNTVQLRCPGCKAEISVIDFRGEP